MARGSAEPAFALRAEPASGLVASRFNPARKMAVHYSTASGLWETPQDFFDFYDARFGFTLDACATAANAKCDRFFTEADDGLAQIWRGVVWMNPPYGREIGAWVRKAWESAQEGATVVCLVPSRTDTRWWHDYCMKGEIEFVRGRLKYGAATGKDAPFPNAIVIFRPTHNTPTSAEAQG